MSQAAKQTIGAEQSPRRARRVTVWEVALVVAITALAGWLRFRQLGDEGVWLDEAFSIWMARLPIRDLFSWIVRIDQHPPLYYVLLHGWLGLGESESTVRSLSALLSTATIPFFYFAARRLLDSKPAAVAAALILALSPFHVRFAQEARMYALLTFNVSVALLALAYLVTGDHRRRWWVLNIVFTWLTLLSHNTAILFFVAVNLGVGVAAWFARDGTGAGVHLPGWRAWLMAQAAVILLWLPWMPSFVTQARAVDREFWIQPPTSETVIATWGTFLSAFLPESRMWTLAGGLVALILGIVALARRRALLTLLLILVLAPMALELLVSLRRPIFYDRTLIWTTLPLFLLLAAGLLLRRLGGLPAIAATGAVAVLLAGNIFALQWYYDSFHKEQWREAAAWVAETAGDEDLLLFNATWVQIPFEYYFERYGKENPMRGAPVDLFDAGILEPKMSEEDLSRLETLVEDHDCVYLIYSHNWYTDPRNLIPRKMGQLMRGVQTRRFVGLEVQQFQRRGTEGCATPDP